MRWVGRIIVGLLAVLGAIMLASFAAVAILGWSFLGASRSTVPETTVLKLDLTTAPSDAGPQNRLVAILSGEQLSLRQLETALERAGRDPRVKGLVAELGATIPLSTVQALRDAVSTFRKQGKFALAFAEAYGETDTGASEYYLASAFEQIWLQPSGDVGLTGIRVETPFFRGSFDKLGIAPHFDKRKEYKNAVNQLTDKSYDSAFKESTESLLSSFYGQLVSGIAAGRGLTPDAVRGLVDQGPFLAKEALAAKLVDRLGFRDEIEDAALKRAGAGAKLVAPGSYLRIVGEPKSGRIIATITANGTIVSGDEGIGSPFGASQVHATAIAKAFNDARKAADVAAIVFRIDSPGGSYTASDVIRRAVAEARKAGKPVIVSMGEAAASGGYFAALPATKIVAEPATLTGSIGVFIGKFQIQGLLDKLGVSIDSAQRGANAGMWSPERDFSDAEWQKVEAMLDSIYGDFTAKVAEARGIEPARMPDVAKGRVWTGEQAQKLGLVDALGGFPEAVRLAREAANIPADASVRFRTYPEPGSEYRQLIKALTGSAGSASVAETPGALSLRLASLLGEKIEALRPLLAELPALLGPGDAFLLMPPVGVR